MKPLNPIRTFLNFFKPTQSPFKLSQSTTPSASLVPLETCRKTRVRQSTWTDPDHQWGCRRCLPRCWGTKNFGMSHFPERGGHGGGDDGGLAFQPPSLSTTPIPPHHTTPHHTPPHHTTPHHTTLHHTTPHPTTPHYTTSHYTPPHHTTPHHTTLHHITLHSTTPHHTTPHHTIPHHTTPPCSQTQWHILPCRTTTSSVASEGTRSPTTSTQPRWWDLWGEWVSDLKDEWFKWFRRLGTRRMNDLDDGWFREWMI